MRRPPPDTTRTYTRFPYTTLFRSDRLSDEGRPCAKGTGDPRSLGGNRALRSAARAAKRPRTLHPSRRPALRQWRHPYGPRHEQGAEGRDRAFRSEEHTSELQSLMRISYAVFCLKKKKKRHHQ